MLTHAHTINVMLAESTRRASCVWHYVGCFIVGKGMGSLTSRVKIEAHCDEEIVKTSDNIWQL